MHEIHVSEYGGPDVLSVVEREPKDPGPEEIQLSVEAAGINFMDIEQRRGNYPDSPSPPFVPGGEVAGRITDVGAAVEGFSVGDQVAAIVLSGGGYTEQLTVPAEELFALDLPRGMGFAEAAAVPIQYLTAHNALHEWGQLEAGERVLIHAAAGGVGSAAVQLAAIAGAEVYGTASTAAKLDHAEQLGMDHGINYETDDLGEALENCGGDFDLVLDGVGGTAFSESLEQLAPGGRIVVYGMASGDIATVATPRILFDNQSILGYHLSEGLQVERLRERIVQAVPKLTDHLEAGRLDVPIGETFDLADAAAAHRFIEDRNSSGKVVLQTD